VHVARLSSVEPMPRILQRGPGNPHIAEGTPDPLSRRATNPLSFYAGRSGGGGVCPTPLWTEANLI
jgi:hypothetical protein